MYSETNKEEIVGIRITSLSQIKSLYISLGEMSLKSYKRF